MDDQKLRTNKGTVDYYGAARGGGKTLLVHQQVTDHYNELATMKELKTYSLAIHVRPADALAWKARAKEEGLSLTRLIEHAMRDYLSDGNEHTEVLKILRRHFK